MGYLSDIVFDWPASFKHFSVYDVLPLRPAVHENVRKPKIPFAFSFFGALKDGKWDPDISTCALVVQMRRNGPIGRLFPVGYYYLTFAQSALIYARFVKKSANVRSFGKEIPVILAVRVLCASTVDEVEELKGEFASPMHRKCQNVARNVFGDYPLRLTRLGAALPDGVARLISSFVPTGSWRDHHTAIVYLIGDRQVLSTAPVDFFPPDVAAGKSEFVVDYTENNDGTAVSAGIPTPDDRPRRFRLEDDETMLYLWGDEGCKVFDRRYGADVRKHLLVVKDKETQPGVVEPLLDLCCPLVDDFPGYMLGCVTNNADWIEFDNDWFLSPSKDVWGLTGDDGQVPFYEAWRVTDGTFRGPFGAAREKECLARVKSPRADFLELAVNVTKQISRWGRDIMTAKYELERRKRVAEREERERERVERELCGREDSAGAHLRRFYWG